MRSKKLIALAGMLLILGASLVFAQSRETNQVQSKQAVQERLRLKFMDQNGDGINDFLRDHDNDGLPNCQDPDWSRPMDGTGYKNQFGQNKAANQFGNRQSFFGGRNWSNSSFRQGLHQFGSGICDGTGPKGRITRKGRG